MLLPSSVFSSSINKSSLRNTMGVFVAFFISLSVAHAEKILTVDTGGEAFQLLAFEYTPDPNDPRGGSLKKEPIVLSHGSRVNAVMNPNSADEGGQIAHSRIDEELGGRAVYIPGGKISINGKTYYTDARWLVVPEDMQIQAQNGSPAKTTLYEVYERSYRTILDDQGVLTYTNGPGYRREGGGAATTVQAGPVESTPSEAEEGLNENAAQAPVEESTNENTSSASPDSAPGNDLGILLVEDNEPGQELTSTRPVANGQTEEVVEAVETPSALPSSVPRPVPRPERPMTYSEELSDAISVRSNVKMDTALTINSNGEGTFKEEAIDIHQGQTFKIVPGGKSIKVSGVNYREVEYISGNDRSGVKKRLLIPEPYLMTAEGDPITHDTPLTYSALADSHAEDSANEQNAATEDEPAVEEQSSTEETQQSDVGSDAGLVCSNPAYFSHLTGGNNNCTLNPANRLVTSSLKEGDVVVAMDKESRACYKISIDIMSYTDDRALNQIIESMTQQRRESFDQISRDLQNGNIGFVSQSEPARNRITASCFARAKRCNVAFGHEVAQPVRLLKSFSTPAMGLESDPARDLKIEIYGPSAEGHYFVRHLKGNVWKRSFLVDDENKIEEAIRQMDEHTRVYAGQRLTASDRVRAARKKPVLFVQKMDEQSELQTARIDLDPSAPFKAVADLNKKYDYYNISCTQTYNPLMQAPAARSSEASESPGVE